MFEIIMLAGFLAAAISQLLPEERRKAPSAPGDRRPENMKTKRKETTSQGNVLHEKGQRRSNRRRMRKDVNRRLTEEHRGTPAVGAF